MIEVRVLDNFGSAEVLRVVRSFTGDSFGEIRTRISLGQPIFVSTYPIEYADSLPEMIATIRMLDSLGVRLELQQSWGSGGHRVVDLQFLENLVAAHLLTVQQDEEYLADLDQGEQA